MTLGVLPSMRATQELVVPRSIPITWPVFAEEKSLPVSACLKIVLIIGNSVDVKNINKSLN